jgi:hypothetical protein
MKRMLFILVEGPDDKRFFEKIVRPLLQEPYTHVRLWMYSREKIERRRNLIKSIKAMAGDYIYVADINTAECVPSRKEKIMQKIGIEEEKVIVVVREIEGWYLAGVRVEHSKKLGISEIRDTDNITKEDFNRLIPTKDSRIVFMERILRDYDVDTGKEKNKSLKYFLNRYCI